MSTPQQTRPSPFDSRGRRAGPGAAGPNAGPEVFVGRHAEVGTLRRLVAEVAAGCGGAVWVEGEPGVGKSALVREGLAESVGFGCTVFWAAADRRRQGSPLEVILDCLGVDGRADDPVRARIAGMLRGEGGLVPAGDAAVAAEQLCELVDQLCAISPVVLVVEDLQWADALSVAVWHRLAGGVGSVPLLIVGVAQRVPQSPVVAAARRGARDRGGVVMELGRLSDGEVAVMVESLVQGVPGPGLLEMAGRAAGNPRYVRELVDALVREDRIQVESGAAEVAGAVEGSGGAGGPAAAGAPTSLAAAIEDRLGFLSEQALECLRVAALLGARFSAGDVAVMQGCPPRQLVGVIREAVTAGVLTTSGYDLVFRHGLIHQALLAAGTRNQAEGVTADGQAAAVARQDLRARQNQDACPIRTAARSREAVRVGSLRTIRTRS